MSTPDEFQHDVPLSASISGASIEAGAPLNLQPPGDTGDLVAKDVISVTAVLLNDGSECFVLITTKGMRHAPVTAHNRLVLSSLVTIQNLPTLAEGGDDIRFADLLLGAEIEGRFNDATLVMDRTGTQWLVVQAGNEVATFVYNDDRYETLTEHGFFVHVKSKRSLSTTSEP